MLAQRVRAQELGLVETDQLPGQTLGGRLQPRINMSEDLVRLHETAVADVRRLVGRRHGILRVVGDDGVARRHVVALGDILRFDAQHFVELPGALHHVGIDDVVPAAGENVEPVVGQVGRSSINPAASVSRVICASFFGSGEVCAINGLMQMYSEFSM
jgi:hypothetical protein